MEERNLSCHPGKNVLSGIIGERNIYLHLGNPAHHESITKIGKAPLRLFV